MTIQIIAPTTAAKVVDTAKFQSWGRNQHVYCNAFGLAGAEEIVPYVGGSGPWSPIFEDGVQVKMTANQPQVILSSGLHYGFVKTATASPVGLDVTFGVSDADLLIGPQGPTGPTGARGPEGKSAYQVALENGFVGEEDAWLASLVGPAGAAGTNGSDGDSAYAVAVANGFVGTESEWLASLQGSDGADGAPGAAGKSAYQSALDTGFVGTEAEWIASLEGTDGTNGTNGTNGVDGDSAYQVAVNNGFVGTEAEWLTSLEGSDGAAGAAGKSAYQSALDNGFVGTEAEWVASLEGAAGAAGADGTDGNTIHSTLGAPSAALGVDNDYAYDATNKIMYGPKDAGAWPAGVSLQGPQGDPGPAGGPFTQTGVGAVERPANDKMAEWVSILDFYDAATDLGDYGPALERAIAESKTVIFPIGTDYTINNPVNYVENLSLIGMGYPMIEASGSVKITAPNGFLKNAVAVPGPGDRNRIYISGLEVIGTGTGICINGPFGGRIENCHFRNYATIIENRESYLLRIVRCSFEDATQGIMLAGANQTRIEDNFFAATCALAIDNYTLDDLSGVGNFGSPMMIRGNNFNMNNGSGPHTCVKLSGMIDFTSNYFEDFGTSSGNTFLDILVGRFGGFGFIVANNEFNGQGSVATHIYVNGDDTLANHAAGIITRNRFLAGSTGDVVFGPNNRIENLRIFDNGNTPGDAINIVNKRATIAYRPMAYGRIVGNTSIAGATFVTLPINEDIVYNNCDAFSAGSNIRPRKDGVYEFEGTVMLQSTGAAYTVEIQLEKDGTTVLETLSVPLAANETKQVTLMWTGDLLLNEDIRLEARNGDLVIAAGLRARWVTVKDGWQ